ncbi:MAG: hypothetical protein OEZ22_11905 [Spirochaetia bacterium]|nr:hypothetical protein [Spirochaetia bacterium]
MKCRKQPLWAKTEIKNVWEVHLDTFIWKKIKLAAKINRKTYSWIVRYCAFQLAKKKNLRWTTNIIKISKRLREQNNIIKHRHMLCLYGDDEFLLRNSALILRVSVSQLVRISIAMFIERLLKEKVSKDNLFWYGIKLYATIKRFRSIKNNNVAMDFHSHIKFLVEEYWGFQ